MNHRQYLSQIGRKGGQAGKGKAKARTSAQASQAAKARWKKHRIEANVAGLPTLGERTANPSTTAK